MTSLFDKTDDAEIKVPVGEDGLWVKDHFDQCELVIHYLDDWGEVVHWDKKFLKEAYDACKFKGLDRYSFLDAMGFEILGNGRPDFKNWEPPLTTDLIAALDFVNQRVSWEGHYSAGAFFAWQWEQELPASGEGKRGYLYILKQPNRFGMGKEHAAD